MTKLSPNQDEKPIDWGRVFVKLMMDLNMSYEEILERTFPQLGALLESASSDKSEDEEDFEDRTEPDEEHTVTEAQAFVDLFRGL